MEDLPGLEPDERAAWCTTNLVGLPPGLVGSIDYNRHPVPLHIAGTRASARSLFTLLDSAPDLDHAADMFGHFMAISFGLGTDREACAGGHRRRWCASYRKLLEGWGFDANSPQGAVLKGWVENRFGLLPTFHRASLEHYPSPAWIAYIEEKQSSRFHNNCIYLQLDLLFEFCQWCARRFALPAPQPVPAEPIPTAPVPAGSIPPAAIPPGPIPPGPIPVWRGVNALDEHRLVAGSLRARRIELQLNNLVSFSLSRDHAGQFGDWILATRVPVEKLLFFPGLLGRSLLAGEGEVIALGGRYELDVAYL